MEHRGHSVRDPGRQQRRSKEEYKYPHQDEDPWIRQDAHHRSHFSSPPPPHYHPHYQHDYSPADHYRPQSRHGYQYPPNTHYSDHRENYGYYDQEYYRTGRAEVAHWAPQDSWRSEQLQYRTYHQEQPGRYYTDQDSFRRDQARDNSQQPHREYQDSSSHGIQDTSSYPLGTLESSKTSGLSSSSFELSQYMNGGEHGDAQTPVTTEAVKQCTGERVPPKFSIPHAVVSFGPAGQLIRVTAGASTQEHIGRVEIHSLEVIFSDTEEQQQMSNYPGPLIRGDLHKVDAIEFAGQRAGDCRSDDTLPDRRSASLLWNLLILLCRQNGQIVGSDIAELLMDEANSDASWEKETPTLIDFSDALAEDAPPCTGDDLLTGSWSSFSPQTSEKALQSYTELLLAGRKKEALESAMSNDLWGHALFLASKMDSRSYTTVLTRFTGQITTNDPLQTLFQLLSGRVPAAATNCGLEKWGDWRPHLAIMLSNDTVDPAVQRRAVVTMGDTLASRGLLHAAHICYLTAGVPFGAFTQETSRLVLLGSSHSQPFRHFSTNLAIQCTELYEYCQTLGGKEASIPSFQVYKFLYATRLLDCGLAAQAFHYCEVVGRALLREREAYTVLTEEVVKLAERLRLSEGQFNDTGLSEPSWLTELCRRNQLGCNDYIETHQSFYDQTSSPVDDSETIQDCGSDILQYDAHDPGTILEYNSGQMAALLLEDRQADGRPAVNFTAPVDVTPLPPSAGWRQDSHHHSTASLEVTSVAPYFPQSESPPAANGAASPYQTNMMNQNTPEDVGYSGPTSDLPTESSKAGWFSGWFTSKPKDKEPFEHPNQSGIVSPHNPVSCPPPPTTIGAPPAHTASTGINPFSRKAGQKLG